MISDKKKRKINKRFNKKYNMIDTNCIKCGRNITINNNEKPICADHLEEIK